MAGKVRGTYGPDKEIMIIYNDLPETDFNELFRFLNGKAFHAWSLMGVT